MFLPEIGSAGDVLSDRYEFIERGLKASSNICGGFCGTWANVLNTNSELFSFKPVSKGGSVIKFGVFDGFGMLLFNTFLSVLN
jgi:hypothetical protein